MSVNTDSAKVLVQRVLSRIDLPKSVTVPVLREMVAFLVGTVHEEQRKIEDLSRLKDRAEKQLAEHHAELDRWRQTTDEQFDEVNRKLNAKEAEVAELQEKNKKLVSQLRLALVAHNKQSKLLQALDEYKSSTLALVLALGDDASVEIK